MGSPLDPILANIFFSLHEEDRLDEYPVAFKTTFYGRFVDGIFVPFESTESPYLFSASCLANICPLNTRK